MFKLKPLEAAREDARWRRGDLVQTERGTVHVTVSGEGPDVLLLHGITDSSLTWRLLEPELGDVRLHMLDLPGHGLSDIPAQAPMPREMAQWAQSYMHVAGIERAVVVGWSLGGAVAIELAALEPERVRALVLLGPAGVRMGMPMGLSLLKLPFVCESMSLLRRDRIARSMAARDMYGPDFEVNEEVMDDYYLGWRIQGRGPFIRGLLRKLDFQETAERGKGVATRAWVVHGEADRIIPAAKGKELASLLPNAELVLLPGVGHTPHVEQPKTVAQTIRTALTS